MSVICIFQSNELGKKTCQPVFWEKNRNGGGDCRGEERPYNHVCIRVGMCACVVDTTGINILQVLASGYDGPQQTNGM